MATAAALANEREAQKSYWLEHSSQPTVEAMMLDSKASEIDQLERPEVLATLGSVAGLRVLELGAGIGRFTGELAKTALRVTACDFMAASIAENRRCHEGLGNVDFLVADVTELQLEPGSYDVVFSNWLLMYLSDAEVAALAAKILSWLTPGGVLFFRESCFRPSGDRPRNGNPTHYRNPRDYFSMFDAAELAVQQAAQQQQQQQQQQQAQPGPPPEPQHAQPGGGGSGSSSSGGGGMLAAHLELVCCKCVDTYVTVKKNQNQICWKYKKVLVPQPRPPLARAFLDGVQYSPQGIAAYEAVFGRGFVSPGGAATSAGLLAGLGLRPGQRVLDVGCGIGGSAFLAADSYGCHVHAIDLSVNMILVAIERAAAAASSRSATPVGGGMLAQQQGGGGQQAAAANGAAGGMLAQQQQQQQAAGMLAAPQQQQPHDVTFEVADVLTRDFPPASFDVVLSRDALLHVGDKARLFKRLFEWLRPGGRLLVTDYCCSGGGDAGHSDGFKAYVAQHGYQLLTLPAYTAALEAAGFSDVAARDATPELISSLEAELAALEAPPEPLLAAEPRGSGGGGGAALSAEQRADLAARWRGKLARARAGEQLWGHFTARRPAQ